MGLFGLGAAASQAGPLADAASPAKVAVITTAGCPFCVKVKSALRGAGIEYAEIDLDRYPQALDAVKKATGQLTVPQVFVGGSLVGGADRTIAELESGELQARLGKGPGEPLPRAVKSALQKAQPEATEITAVDAPALSPERMRAALEAKRALRGAGAAGPLRTHRVGGGGPLCFLGGAGEDRCFVVGEGAAYLAEVGAVPSRQDGLAVVGDMLKGRMLQVVCKRGPAGSPVDWIVRFAEDAPPPVLGRPLNAPFAYVQQGRPAVEVSRDLRRRMLRLKGEFLSDDGSRVDYGGMRASPAFAEFAEATAELQVVDPSALPPDERKAFFINIYNIIIIHATVALGAPRTGGDRLKFFAGAMYDIGGHIYSADDVEHGVLRCNRPSPASLVSVPLPPAKSSPACRTGTPRAPTSGRPVPPRRCLTALPPLSLPRPPQWYLLGMPERGPAPFKEGDPRLRCVLPGPVDPRLHFSLVCGAKSCPPVRVFDGSNIDEGLRLAAESFLEDRTEVDERRRLVTASMILKWYRHDFGADERGMLEEVTRLMRPGSEKRLALERLLESAGGVAVTYSPYDWGTNS